MRTRRSTGSFPDHDPLLADEVERALESLPEGVDALRSITILSRCLAPDLARRAAALHELRTRARARFPVMELRYLHAKGLEQATSERVARERARVVHARAPGASLFDATCSLGADLLALALEGVDVVGGDLDVESLRYARANLAHHGRVARLLRADAARPPLRSALWLVDPDRRADARRALDPAAWSPPLDVALGVARSFDGACLKLAPALDADALLAAEAAALPAGLARRREWLSRAGELVEVTLWTGALAGAAATGAERVAVRLAPDGARARGGRRRAAGGGRPGARRAAERRPSCTTPTRRWCAPGCWAGWPRAKGSPAGAAAGLPRGRRALGEPFLRAFRVLGSAPLDRKRVRAPCCASTTWARSRCASAATPSQPRRSRASCAATARGAAS
ncbi:MAG: hypothetical protein H6828_05920 [Planctomycetes bacterium]|nr:hypothetical protein [Planctomycetota bacterium]